MKIMFEKFFQMNIWGRLIRSLLKNYMSKDTGGNL